MKKINQSINFFFHFEHVCTFWLMLQATTTTAFSRTSPIYKARNSWGATGIGHCAYRNSKILSQNSWMGHWVKRGLISSASRKTARYNSSKLRKDITVLLNDSTKMIEMGRRNRRQFDAKLASPAGRIIKLGELNSRCQVFSALGDPVWLKRRLSRLATAKFESKKSCDSQHMALNGTESAWLNAVSTLLIQQAGEKRNNVLASCYEVNSFKFIRYHVRPATDEWSKIVWFVGLNSGTVRLQPDLRDGNRLILLFNK